MHKASNDARKTLDQFRDRRRRIRERYGDASHREALAFFERLQPIEHFPDPLTGEPLLRIERNGNGATFTPFVGFSWRLIIGPAIILHRDVMDAEPELVDWWDLAIPDGNDVQFIRANLSGDAPQDIATWRELLNRLASQAIAPFMAAR